MRRIRVFLTIGLVGCEREEFHDVPDDWDEMLLTEQEEYLDDLRIALEECYLDSGAYVID